MLRRVALAAVAGSLIAVTSLVTGGPRFSASAAASGVACEITGTASLSPGVTALPKATAYTFTGALKSCKSTDGTIKSGTVSASGAGSLGCAGGTSKGVATVTWNNGKTSTISFSTDDALAAVAVNGTTTAGEFAKDKIAGELNFVTTAAASCVSGGISTLNFTGAVTGG